MSKHALGGRQEYFGMKASVDEMALFSACAKRAGCSVSELVRWLFVDYASRQNVSAEHIQKCLGKPPAGIVLAR
jgi:hypothetical protein